MRALQITDIDRAALSLVKFIKDGYVLTIITLDRKGFYELKKVRDFIKIERMSHGRIISSIKSSVKNCNQYIAQLLDDEESKYAVIDDSRREIICSKSKSDVK